MKTTALQVILFLVICSSKLVAPTTVKCDKTQYSLARNDTELPGKCLPCPDCNFGEQPPAPCGTKIDVSHSTVCVPCVEGESFKAERGYKTFCKPCTRCFMNEIVNATCQRRSDAVCSGVCEGGYVMNKNRTACKLVIKPSDHSDLLENSTTTSTLKTEGNQMKKNEESTKIQPTSNILQPSSPEQTFGSTHTQPLTTNEVPSRAYKTGLSNPYIAVIIVAALFLPVFIILVVVVIRCCSRSTSYDKVPADTISGSEISSTDISRHSEVNIDINEAADKRDGGKLLNEIQLKNMEEPAASPDQNLTSPAKQETQETGSPPMMRLHGQEQNTVTQPSGIGETPITCISFEENKSGNQLMDRLQCQEQMTQPTSSHLDADQIGKSTGTIESGKLLMLHSQEQGFQLEENSSCVNVDVECFNDASKIAQHNKARQLNVDSEECCKCNLKQPEKKGSLKLWDLGEEVFREIIKAFCLDEFRLNKLPGLMNYSHSIVVELKLDTSKREYVCGLLKYWSGEKTEHDIPAFIEILKELGMGALKDLVSEGYEKLLSTCRTST